MDAGFLLTHPEENNTHSGPVTRTEDKFITQGQLTHYLKIGRLQREKNYISGEIRTPLYVGVTKRFLDWPPGARTANGTAICQ
jgi:hypothetical protein